MNVRATWMLGTLIVTVCSFNIPNYSKNDVFENEIMEEDNSDEDTYQYSYEMNDGDDFCVDRKPGNYKDPDRCNGFISCVHGIRYDRQCNPRTLTYNEEEDKCLDIPCDGKPRSPTVAAKAKCVLTHGAKGTIDITTYSDGSTKLNGVVTNIDPGKHGFHVHELGEISNGCGGAGGHYNPFGKTHGAPTDVIRHVGDLGNIIAASGGTATVDITDRLVSLIGTTSIYGRAIVVHKMEDDLGRGGNEGSLKTGNAGARIGCCVIVHA